MKKIIYLFLISALLCGCSEGDKSSNNVEPTTEVWSISDSDESVDYPNLEAFRSSDFYAEIVSEGGTPYHLEYDEERYTLDRITSNVSFYKFTLYDNIEQKQVRIEIIYDAYVENVQGLRSIFTGEDNIMTTADLNGETHDVFLVASSLKDEEDYGLLYMPFPHCQVSIYAGNSSTKEEILSYFDDFELVADN